MMSDKKVKKIELRATMVGKGIVNYDSSDQGKMFFGKKGLEHLATKHNNVSYAQKDIYGNDDTGYTHKIKISSGCIKSGIFPSMLNKNQNMMGVERLYYQQLAKPEHIIRGWTDAEKGNINKRSSALNITDATQTCNAVSKLEVHNRSGYKKTEGDTSDISFFYKENVGDINYAFEGEIDLNQLQFVSISDIFDRKAFNADKFWLFKEYFTKLYPSFASVEPKNYILNTSVNQCNERGFVFDNEIIVSLVNFLLKNINNINIKRANSFAKTVKLEYNLVYDPFDDKNWKEYKDDINFVSESYYTETNAEEDAIALSEYEAKKEGAKANEKKIKDTKDLEKAKKRFENHENGTEVINESDLKILRKNIDKLEKILIN